MNLKALYALVPAAAIAVLCVALPPLRPLANFSWFIGVGLSALFYWALTRAEASAPMRVLHGEA